MSRLIIEKTTAAATGAEAISGGTWPKTIHVAGELVDEAIAVNIIDIDGDDQPLYDDVGAAVTIVKTSRPLEITSPITLQFVKPVTANAVGIQVCE